MRILFISVFLFISISSFSQLRIDSVLAKDACECIMNTKGLTAKTFPDCFLTAAQKNQTELEKELMEHATDTSYDDGEKIGRQIADRISINMIYTCEAYYHLIDTLRYSELMNVNKDSLRFKLHTISEVNGGNLNSSLLTERGITYFQLSSLDKALNDFNAALELDKNATQSLFFKGWVLELQKKYDEALDIYTKLLAQTSNSYFSVFIAIVKRKKTES